MFSVDSLCVLLFLLLINHQCFSITLPRNSKNRLDQAFPIGVSSLNFDSDDEDYIKQHESAGVYETFSDSENGQTDLGSSASIKSSIDQRFNQFTLSESDSDDETNDWHELTSGTSGFASGSSSFAQSDNDQSHFIFDQDIEPIDQDRLISPDPSFRQKTSGSNPSRSFLNDRSNSNRYPNRQVAFLASSPDDKLSSENFNVLPSVYDTVRSFDNMLSPPRKYSLNDGSVASLNELYKSPIGGFYLDKNLWPSEDRHYLKSARPPPVPRTNPADLITITSRAIPKEFLQAVEFGKTHNNTALGTMKWTKTFVSGNSATVYGIELNGKNFILKITKHSHFGGSQNNDISPCVHEDDIHSLHESTDPCNHKPRDGLIRKPFCSAHPYLVPFEYYIAEKVACTHGSMPAAASVSHTFGKNEHVWYLIYEELPGISPLKYGENILERLAKPLIRQQLEALKEIARCHIMHLDAHWGNVLYSIERGIQLIDFGIATLVDRFELPDAKAALIVTFTFDRCLDCEASKLGRDFKNLFQSHYPIDGDALLSHPWLQY